MVSRAAGRLNVLIINYDGGIFFSATDKRIPDNISCLIVQEFIHSAKNSNPSESGLKTECTSVEVPTIYSLPIRSSETYHPSTAVNRGAGENGGSAIDARK